MQAAFSEFVSITPKNEEEHNIHVTVISLDNKKDQYAVKIPLMITDKHTWLIICKNPLSPKKQNFREYIWSSGKEGDKGILVITKLHLDKDGSELKDKNMEKYSEIMIHKDLIKRAYIYIDYSSPIFDGGFYYSIDLQSYLPYAK